ncbi:MAG: histidinol dehydrogenase [Cyclobacteriaceae bacterium]|jgi:histidinol dehydrogenase|nr:histidinol dehydrogenase [Cyclobacteriaceae bacterium]
MQLFINPARSEWAKLIQRPELELGYLESTVKNIFNRVKHSGDQALLEMASQYDKATITSLVVSESELQQGIARVPVALQEAIRQAADNIEKFHRAQLRQAEHIETMPGVYCWRKGVPVERVGIYIPGGTAPLFSTVLMLAVPARVAGCKEIILCSPPDAQGNIHPAILYAASLTGVTRICKAGGAQAIGAMAYGTESIPRVSKIFGPGNQYVTKAKQLVSQEGVAIDLPAGPSEVLVWADETAIPSFVAADLLSQAEHGADSQVILVLSNEKLISEIQGKLTAQLNRLPRKELAQQALQHSRIVVLTNENDALDFINEYAPEHLIISVNHAEEKAEQILNAGSIFIGNFSPESAGDYASGTNHTLPTNGYAKAYGGVSTESFLRYITYQKISGDGLKKLGPVVETMAEAELLEAHRAAVSIRLEYLKQNPQPV